MSETKENIQIVELYTYLLIRLVTVWSRMINKNSKNIMIITLPFYYIVFRHTAIRPPNTIYNQYEIYKRS